MARAHVVGPGCEYEVSSLHIAVWNVLDYNKKQKKMASATGSGRRPASRINRRNPTPALTAALGSSGIVHCLQYDSGLTQHPLGEISAAAAASPPPTALELGGRRHFSAPTAKIVAPSPPHHPSAGGEGHQQPASPVVEHQHAGGGRVSRALVTRVGDALNQNQDNRFARVPQPEPIGRRVLAAGATSTKLGAKVAHPSERSNAAVAAALPPRQPPPFALDETGIGIAHAPREKRQPPREVPAPPTSRAEPRAGAPKRGDSPPAATRRHQMEAGVSSRERDAGMDAGDRGMQGHGLPLRDLRKLGSF